MIVPYSVPSLPPFRVWDKIVGKELCVAFPFLGLFEMIALRGARNASKERHWHTISQGHIVDENQIVVSSRIPKRSSFLYQHPTSQAARTQST